MTPSFSQVVAFLRRSLPTVALLTGASALLLVTDQAGTRRSRPAVAVLKQVSTAVLDDAVTGMLEGLAEKGWRDGETVTIRQFNAEGDMSQAKVVIDADGRRDQPDAELAGPFDEPAAAGGETASAISRPAFARYTAVD